MAARLIRTLARAARTRGAVDVAFVGSAESRRWNRTYRGERGPANVLSFDLGGGTGQVLLDRTLLSRSARAYGWPLRFEFARLTLHGLLHLAGHTHARAPHRRRMESAERRILSRTFPTLRTHPTVRQWLSPHPLPRGSSRE